MIFNNHPSVSMLNMTGIRRSVMHQWTVSWRHVWLVKIQVWPRKEWEFYSSYKGKFWTKIYSSTCYEQLFDMLLPQIPSWLFLMAVITFGVIFHDDAVKPNMCLLSSIHTNEKLNRVVFNHCYQYHSIKCEQAIALINKKNPNHYINFAVSPPLISALIISAVTRGFNQSQH